MEVSPSLKSGKSQVCLSSSGRESHCLVVNCPTRWSLLFIFVFLCWSSSWRLGPHIEGGRLLWPLLKAGMTVLTQFFCKMYFLYVSRGRKNFWGEILCVLPLQKQFFSPPLGPVWVLQKLRLMRKWLICFTEATQLLEKFYENCGSCGSLISFTPPL